MTVSREQTTFSAARSFSRMSSAPFSAKSHRRIALVSA
jgi:hypothetical protein